MATSGLSLLLAATASVEAAGPSGSLVVADTAAARLYVYSLPDLALTGDFADIKLAAHAGTIPLEDGRLLLEDDAHQQLVILDTASDKPSIVAKIDIPTAEGARYGWNSVDTAGRYYVTTSDDDENAIETLNIVDLQAGTARQIKIDTGKPDAELGVEIGGAPESVFLHFPDSVVAYPLDALLADGVTALPSDTVKPSSTISVGEGGHGTTVVDATQQFIASTKRGLEIASFKDGQFGPVKTVSWDVGELKGGQNYRQRLTSDGSTIFGPLNAPSATPEQWADAEIDLHWVNLADGTAQRTLLAHGIVGRGGVSKTLAAYASIQQDGHFLNLVNVDPSSPDFRKVASVPLEPLKDGPVAGQSSAGKQGRYAAISPDGSLAFATNGGEGSISVIDTKDATVVNTITTPTPLDGGGYIVAIAPGTPLYETAGR